jgi:hypothetical protein
MSRIIFLPSLLQTVTRYCAKSKHMVRSWPSQCIASQFEPGSKPASLPLDWWCSSCCCTHKLVDDDQLQVRQTTRREQFLCELCFFDPPGPAKMCKYPGPVKLERPAHASLDVCFDALSCSTKDVALVGEDIALLQQPTRYVSAPLTGSFYRLAGVFSQRSSCQERVRGSASLEHRQGGRSRARGCPQAHLHQGMILHS